MLSVNILDENREKAEPQNVKLDIWGKNLIEIPRKGESISQERKICQETG